MRSLLAGADDVDRREAYRIRLAVWGKPEDLARAFKGGDEGSDDAADAAAAMGIRLEG